MKTEELLGQALEIRSPWQISRVMNDVGKDQVDIWISRESTRGSWFFGSRNESRHGQERSWRHINLGNLRCVVHFSGNESDGDSAGWIGDADQPFTRALSRKIAGMLMEGVSFQSICTLLDVTVADLWKFKHRLDSGKSGLSGRTQTATPSGPAGIPDANDPVWERLLDGSLKIDVHLLSLNLLLTKLREQFAVISDPEVRIMKAHEMQRYFVRHEKLLAREIAQLSRP
jgi:hypothetical protein